MFLVNVYIVYEISKNINISNYATIEICLFGAVKLTENADFDKYGHSGYGIRFLGMELDRHKSFLFPGTGLVKNVIFFVVDMSLSTKIDNKKRIF